MATSAKSEGSFYIPCLDGIRAIALLMVFAGHTALGKWVPAGFGVTIFFFLSGYLITSLLRLEEQRTGQISLKNFYIRRVFRILPPMYITLALVAILAFAGVLPQIGKLGAYLAAILNTFNYYSLLPGHGELPGPGLQVFWSLAVEEHFYLLFPVVFVFFLKSGGGGEENTSRRGVSLPRRAAWLILACIVALVWRTVLIFVFHTATTFHPPPGTNQIYWTYSATDCRFDSIAWGCILALRDNPLFPADSNSPFARRKGLFALLGLIGIALSVSIRNPQFRETLRYTLQGISLYPLFYYCAASGKSWVVHTLEWKPLRWIGWISYSMYLSHLVILTELDRRLPSHPFYAAILTMVLTILYAWAMRVFVENPLHKLRASFISPAKVRAIPVNVNG